MLHLINFAAESVANLTNAGLDITGAVLKCAGSVTATLAHLFLIG